MRRILAFVIAFVALTFPAAGKHFVQTSYASPVAKVAQCKSAGFGKLTSHMVRSTDGGPNYAVFSQIPSRAVSPGNPFSPNSPSVLFWDQKGKDYIQATYGSKWQQYWGPSNSSQHDQDGSFTVSAPANSWVQISLQEGTFWVTDGAKSMGPCHTVDVTVIQRDGNPAGHATGVNALVHVGPRGAMITSDGDVHGHWAYYRYPAANTFNSNVWFGNSQNEGISNFPFNPGQCGNATGCAESSTILVDQRTRAVALGIVAGRGMAINWIYGNTTL